MVNSVKNFFKSEAASAIILFLMAIIALILCNSPWSVAYQKFLQLRLAIHIDHYVLAQPLLFWVNEGLMTLFFLNVGLELKQELLGNDQHYANLILPFVAALGGMLAPAIIYTVLNFSHSERLVGWAIPVATDIAFALGVLSLFGKRVPAGLKMFLLALAVFDDVGAIIIVAFFHPPSLSSLVLGLLCTTIILLGVLNLSRVRFLPLYLLLGLILWLCVLKSGVHATVAGVVLGLSIPPGTASRLQHFLQAWVAFFIMPLFAFVNAGVDLRGLSAQVLIDSITLGIVLGLCIGKPLGVMLFSWAIAKLGRLNLPQSTTWFELFGVAGLCGIGFTMSLFLGTLAFQTSALLYLVEVKLGVLIGSVLSGIIGAFILQFAFAKKRSLKGKQFEK